MPLISVIMGVYNSRSDMLFKAVNSILNQTVGDFELIICNDGSSAHTAEALSQLPQDSRIKIIALEKNCGLAAALNACIDSADGEFIARQDDDDYSAENRFEIQLEYMKNNPDVDFIGTDCYLFDKSGKIYSERIMPKEITAKSYLFNSPFIHGSMMFRKKVFEKHRYRTLGKERKYEDYDLFMRLTADGFKSANLQDRLYYFYFDTELRKLKFRMRLDEYAVRKEGFKALRLMPKGYFYAVKPILLGFIPTKLFMKMKKMLGRV